jgi:DNA-directed RNA polymerase subunit K/omega
MSDYESDNNSDYDDSVGSDTEEMVRKTPKKIIKPISTKKDEEEDDVSVSGSEVSDNEEDDDEEEDLDDDDNSMASGEGDEEDQEEGEQGNAPPTTNGRRSIASRRPPRSNDDEDNDDDNDDADDEDDEEEEYEDEYVKELSEDLRKTTIQDFYPDLQPVNTNEVEVLCHVVRDSTGTICDPLHTTIPFITKYEKAKIIGERARQINAGAKPFIDVEEGILDGYVIALKEFEAKKTPFIIKRPLPNGGCEYWRLTDLEYI